MTRADFSRPRLLDTDTLSFYLKGVSAVVAVAETYIKEQGKLAFSLITYYEVLRGLKSAGLTHKIERFRVFALDSCHLTPLTPEVFDIASGIYADLNVLGQPLPDADILVAASCLSENRILVTNNKKHFQRISGLVIESWS
ncbi:MAG: type II toxin-antitoxin system VapC family toxin [Elusimicrobia bacterium]|nr:type II toxin-antitoxin system VapC family toxin [Elusimicrobiota bacterium]